MKSYLLYLLYKEKHKHIDKHNDKQTQKDKHKGVYSHDTTQNGKQINLFYARQFEIQLVLILLISHCAKSVEKQH